jgi:hypothetical protein
MEAATPRSMLGAAIVATMLAMLAMNVAAP